MRLEEIARSRRTPGVRRESWWMVTQAVCFGSVQDVPGYLVLGLSRAARESDLGVVFTSEEDCSEGRRLERVKWGAELGAHHGVPHASS